MQDIDMIINFDSEDEILAYERDREYERIKIKTTCEIIMTGHE